MPSDTNELEGELGDGEAAAENVGGAVLCALGLHGM